MQQELKSFTTIMAYKALDIAHKLLTSAKNVEGGELMSNMKLQKMLYYQQGFHLAKFNEPLFEEDIEAWMYGPVVPLVYNQFCSFGANGILPAEDEPIELRPMEEKLFNEVFTAYAQFSAIGLMNMTHKEKPWMNTKTGVGNVIPKGSLKNYFKTKLK